MSIVEVISAKGGVRDDKKKIYEIHANWYRRPHSRLANRESSAALRVLLCSLFHQGNGAHVMCVMWHKQCFRSCAKKNYWLYLVHVKLRCINCSSQLGSESKSVHCVWLTFSLRRRIRMEYVSTSVNGMKVANRKTTDVATSTLIVFISGRHIFTWMKNNDAICALSSMLSQLSWAAQRGASYKDKCFVLPLIAPHADTLFACRRYCNRGMFCSLSSTTRMNPFIVVIGAARRCYRKCWKT